MDDDLPPDPTEGLPPPFDPARLFRADLTDAIPVEFYTAVGQLSKQWADIELFNRMVLSKVLSVEYDTILLLTSGMQSRTLLDTARRAVHHILPEYAKTYDKTYDRLMRVHEYRNRIIHSVHSGGLEGYRPAGTYEIKVRLNKKGLSFHRAYKLAAHQVKRYALLSRLLVFKLCEIHGDAGRILLARRELQEQGA
jgi:hypothetical protein